MNIKFISENLYQGLPTSMYQFVEPTPLINPRFVHGSVKIAQQLNLISELTTNQDELVSWINGESGELRIASAYAGHQFGHWAGQLGDGRALSMGEFKSLDGSNIEIQTKGSGLTPYSRQGDGKAVIRSTVREYLGGEALHGLQIPCSMALCLIIGDDPVYRESIERSGLLARVFPSNLRFGHFELAKKIADAGSLKQLIEYTQSRYFKTKNTKQMLHEVMTSTAQLIAKWMSVGFCHGVMNTDNMSIHGITLDFGPYGFLEDTDLNHICNHSDPAGRYAYDQQPQIGLWNLEKLFVCFLEIVPKVKLEEILNLYSDVFQEEWLRLFSLKIGFNDTSLLSDKQKQRVLELIQDIHLILHREKIDFTFFFRQLSTLDLQSPETSLFNFYKFYPQSNALRTWILQLTELHLECQHTTENLKQLFLKVNPKFILKNYIAQEIIEDVENNQFQSLDRWIQILQNPFAEHPEFQKYSEPTSENNKHCEVSCSS